MTLLKSKDRHLHLKQSPSEVWKLMGAISAFSLHMRNSTLTVSMCDHTATVVQKFQAKVECQGWIIGAKTVEVCQDHIRQQESTYSLTEREQLIRCVLILQKVKCVYIVRVQAGTRVCGSVCSWIRCTGNWSECVRCGVDITSHTFSNRMNFFRSGIYLTSNRDAVLLEQPPF